MTTQYAVSFQQTLKCRGKLNVVTCIAKNTWEKLGDTKCTPTSLKCLTLRHTDAFRWKHKLWFFHPDLPGRTPGSLLPSFPSLVLHRSQLFRYPLLPHLWRPQGCQCLRLHPPEMHQKFSAGLCWGSQDLWGLNRVGWRLAERATRIRKAKLESTEWTKWQEDRAHKEQMD